ncbi:hypothetical protein, partial [Alicyclobacillus sp.]|uniref:beta-mannosidase n=1 Tax=Alicyclobacillus sp. TaxID=61169 RepID=UPI0025BD717E
MQLHNGWKIKGFAPGTFDPLVIAHPDFDDGEWLAADVPGDVHTTLIRHGLIEHPFFGDYDQRCRWLEERVWWYRTSFSFDEDLPPDARVELVFEGIDTFATVYLNGLEVAESANMFVPLEVDVTRELVREHNVLAVRIDPVALRVAGKDTRFWSGYSKERIWVRKAQMHWGWDWAPRLVTAGIWKPVRLERRRRAHVRSIMVRTLAVSEAKATLAIRVDLEPVALSGPPGALCGAPAAALGTPTALCGAPVAPSDPARLQVSIRMEDAGQQVASVRRPAGFGRNEVRIEVPRPKLWWTHDLGEPHLYTLAVEVFAGGERVASRRLQIGIRTLEVRTRDDAGRPAFTLVLNGVPVFAKGANWIPVDSFIAAAPDSRYLALLELVREAHMNMLRVWGGGVYEKDIFYETCNRLGILVWQDFMFACALYPDFNQTFLREVEREVRHVVACLQHHPCIALWCGNNENDWIWERGRVTGEIDTPFYGERIYHELIPAVVASLDPDRFYWPSSPYGGSDHNAAEEGDRHNWQVWHGHVYPRRFGEPEWTNFTPEGISFRHYAEDEARFVSEFGIHAAANRHTLARWIPPEALHWGSPALAYRNKDTHPEKGLWMMEAFTGLPRTLDEYIAFSMLTQAEGLKFGVEHYRRRKFETSGALIWQLNDCWPGTSWSIIDYHLLPKAAYSYARRFFHPVLLCARFEAAGPVPDCGVGRDPDRGSDRGSNPASDRAADRGLDRGSDRAVDQASGRASGLPSRRVTFWVVHDGRTPYTDDLVAEVLDFDGRVLWARTFQVRGLCNAARCVGEVDEAEMLGAGGASPETVVLRIRSARGLAPDNFHYFRDPKDLRLPAARLAWHVDADRGTVTITTDRHARLVTLD